MFDQSAGRPTHQLSLIIYGLPCADGWLEPGREKFPVALAPGFW